MFVPRIHHYSLQTSQKIRSWYLSFAIFCSYAYAITPFVLGYGFKRLHQHRKQAVFGFFSVLVVEF